MTAFPPAIRGLVLLLVLGMPTWASGQTQDSQGDAPGIPTPITHPGSHLDVYLITAGSGAAIWSQFGHNAIQVVDHLNGTDQTWEWGVFSFAQEGFMVRLMQGSMLYTMDRKPTASMLETYRREGRAVWRQALSLSPEEKWALQEALLANWEPAENRTYRYDYYRDNCSTRVRDVLDLVLGGELRSQIGDDPTPRTYRWHTRRLLNDVPWAYVGIQVALSGRADRPITAWEEAFLPMQFQSQVRSVQLERDAGGTGGATSVPLVSVEEQLLEAVMPEDSAAPPFLLLHFLFAGILGACILFGTAHFAEGGGVIARIPFALAATGWTLLAGALGSILTAAWFFTDHVFWAWNESLFQANPVFLLLLPAILGFLWRGRVPGWSATVASALAVIAMAGFVLQILPWLNQVNGEILAFALPMNVAMAYGFILLERRDTSEK